MILNDPDLVDDTGLELVASTRIQTGSSSINFLNCIICDTQSAIMYYG